MQNVINTDNAPKVIGPYSQAISCGNTMFISGQLPVNPQTDDFISTDIEDQTKQSLLNIKAILEAGGFELKDLIKTTIYLADMSYYQEMNDVYSNFLVEPFPTRVAFAVKGLPKGALVEIDAIAIRQ